MSGQSSTQNVEPLCPRCRAPRSERSGGYEPSPIRSCCVVVPSGTAQRLAFARRTRQRTQPRIPGRAPPEVVVSSCRRAVVPSCTAERLPFARGSGQRTQPRIPGRAQREAVVPSCGRVVVSFARRGAASVCASEPGSGRSRVSQAEPHQKLSCRRVVVPSCRRAPRSGHRVRVGRAANSIASVSPALTQNCRAVVSSGRRAPRSG